VENAFGVLASLFRVLGTTINLEPLKVLACATYTTFVFEKMKKAVWLLVGKLWIDVLLWSWKEQSVETLPRKPKT
jgi:hypothetical protein